MKELGLDHREEAALLEKKAAAAKQAEAFASRLGVSKLIPSSINMGGPMGMGMGMGMGIGMSDALTHQVQDLKSRAEDLKARTEHAAAAAADTLAAAVPDVVTHRVEDLKVQTASAVQGAASSVTSLVQDISSGVTSVVTSQPGKDQAPSTPVPLGRTTRTPSMGALR